MAFVTATVVLSSAAQSTTNSFAPARLNSFPLHRSPPIPPSLTPLPPSPLIFFRKLLAMSPQQREGVLANKPPAVRARILAKVNEYAALDPGDCELRLRATDLRWYLMPLLRAPADQRTTLLATVPDDMRGLVQSRLTEWEILPPPLQHELLDNEHILAYFSEVGTTNNAAGIAKPSDAEQARWNAMPDNEHQIMIAEFNHFVELSNGEKQRALGGLSGPERAQMEKTLQMFDRLPPPERIQCIRAFGKFAGMSLSDRAEFLKNAQRWSKMTPAERKAWCDLVAHIPQWPPQPPPAMIMPHVPLPQNVHAFAATNRG